MTDALLAAALAARENAHAPFSNFKVGAALEDAIGRIHHRLQCGERHLRTHRLRRTRRHLQGHLRRRAQVPRAWPWPPTPTS